MPKIFEWRGYKFFFFANEGEPLEKCHVHARKGKSSAKFWIEPQIELASSYGISARELNAIRGIIEKNEKIIRRKWNDFFKHRS
jgi:hypothetical protein